MKQSYNFRIKTKTSRFQSHVQCENENSLFLRSCAKPQTSTSSPPHWKEAKKNWLLETWQRGELGVRCQERGLGVGLGGAAGWGRLQLPGSEVTSRCPSQPPAPSCFSLLSEVSFQTAKCNSGACKGQKGKSCSDSMASPLEQQMNSSCFDVCDMSWMLRNKKIIFISSVHLFLSFCPQTHERQSTSGLFVCSGRKCSTSWKF